MSYLDQLLADPLKFPHPYNSAFPDIGVYNVDEPGKPRIYVTPDGRFPSVTSVLGHGEDMSWLDDWREKIGHEKADAISERSRNRGSTMHAVLEAAIKDEPYEAVAGDDIEALEMARAIARQLFPEVSEFRALEHPVWSTRLKLAGRLDAYGIHQGIHKIIDFKNARRLKTRTDIHGYFHQASLYAMCLLEREGIWCPKILICIAQGDDRVGRADLFEENTEDWMPGAIQKARAFYA